MNNNQLFSSLNIDVKDREELKNPLLDRIRYIIRDSGDKTYLFITNLLEVDEEYLKFSYIRGILKGLDYIFQERKRLEELSSKKRKLCNEKRKYEKYII